jgi:hypothetical protein
VRGMSIQPCQRPARFHSDSPWRTISRRRTGEVKQIRRRCSLGIDVDHLV